MANLTQGIQRYGANLLPTPFTLTGSIFDVGTTIVFYLDTSGNLRSWAKGRSPEFNTLPGTNKDQLPAFAAFQVNPAANITTDDAVVSFETAIANEVVNTTALQHILITGQSLSTGYIAAGGSILSTTPSPRHKMFTGGVNTAALTGTATLAPLVETVNGLNGETIASGMTIALQKFLETTSRKNVVFLVSGHGVPSAAMSVIRKAGTGTAFNIGQSQVIQGKRLAEASSLTYRVHAVCLIHGESDEQASTANYNNLLLNFINDYSNDINANGGEITDTILLLCQVSSHTAYNKTRPTIALAQLKASIDNPRKIFLVCPKYFLPYSDTVHLTPDGERQLGEYYAEAYKTTVFLGRRWIPLSPSTVAKNASNAVLITFNVPANGNLAIDATTVPLRGTTSNSTNVYGFELFDAQNTPLTIASVAVANKIATITPSTGTPTRVAYACDGVSGAAAGGSTGARGNLRSTTQAPSNHGYTNWHWATHFDISFDYFIHEYLFNEASGNAVIDSGANLTNGLIVGNPTRSALGITTNGTSSYIELPQTALSASSWCSFVVVRPDALPASGSSNIMGADTTFSGAFALGNVYTSGTSLFQLWSNIGNTSFVSNTVPFANTNPAFAVGNWYCICSIFDGVNLKISINGATPVSRNNAGVGVSSFTKFFLGRTAGTQPYFAGTYAYYSVFFSSGLTNAEITAKYNEIKAKLSPRGVTLP